MSDQKNERFPFVEVDMTSVYTGLQSQKAAQKAEADRVAAEQAAADAAEAARKAAEGAK